jgi:hypothetical protein
MTLQPLTAAETHLLLMQVFKAYVVRYRSFLCTVYQAASPAASKQGTCSAIGKAYQTPFFGTRNLLWATDRMVHQQHGLQAIAT